MGASDPASTCLRLLSRSCSAAVKFALAGTHVVPELHQVPIQVENGRNRGGHLLAELQIRHLDVVLLHADVAPIHGRSETVQQVLRDLQIEITGGVRIDVEERAVDVGVLVVDT